MRDLSKSLEAANITYDELIPLANSIIKKCTADADKIIEEAKQNVYVMTNDYIRNIMLNLSFTSYSFSELKEKSALKAVCAEILKDENYSIELNKADGTVAQKQSAALLNNIDNVLVEAVYDMVANSIKTKLDEIHRVVDTLKNVLISRQTEAKLAVSVDSGASIE